MTTKPQRDWNNFFKPEDFKSDRILDDSSGTDDPTMYDAADIANKILREYLKDAPIIHTDPGNSDCHMTHTARLVDIRKL